MPALLNFCEKFLRLSSQPHIHFIYTHDVLKDRFRHGVKANTEISHWSLKALSKSFKRVHFLRLQGEKQARIRSIRPQDLVIGHVGETFLRAREQTKRVIAFYPWCGHEDRSFNTLFNCLPWEEEKNYWEKAASIVLLTSEYNVKSFLNNPQSFWYDYYQQMRKKKSIRYVHQPLDLTFFKRIKWEYQTSNFLYVGNDAHMKCLPESKKLVETLQRGLSLYGVGPRRLDHLNETQVKSLAEQADFFIQPGMWEGQCVAILEAAARGFIPVVSPETGYPYFHPFLLRYGDFSYNLQVLKNLLQTTPAERKQLADTLHGQLEQDQLHNNWNQLTDVLVEEARALL